MTDGVNIAFSPAVARVPRGRVSPQADRGGASFRGKISFTIGALSWSRAPRHSPNFMDWKMGASLSLIPELEEVVQHGSRQKRVETLRRIMGHSTVLVTERYAHLQPGHFNVADRNRLTADMGGLATELATKSAVGEDDSKANIA